MTARAWLIAFFNALDNVYKSEGRAAVQWTDTEWTEFLGNVLERVGKNREVDCYVAQRRKVVKEDFYSGEYLNVDAMFIDDDAYNDHKDSKYDPFVLPKVVVELENSYEHKKILYCLWKILCIRSSLRILVCYQANQEKVSALKDLCEGFVRDRGLMKGEQGSLLILIGNEDEVEIPDDAPWEKYFAIYEWQGPTSGFSNVGWAEPTI